MNQRLISGLRIMVSMAALVAVFLLGKACARETHIQEAVGGYVVDTAVRRLLLNVSLLVRHNTSSASEFRRYHKEIVLQKVHEAESLLSTSIHSRQRQRLCEVAKYTMLALEEDKRPDMVDKMIIARLREITQACTGMQEKSKRKSSLIICTLNVRP